MSPNSTPLVTHVSTRHGTFDVSSPCILAVSSLSNSTARHARYVERVVSYRYVTSQVEFVLYLGHYVIIFSSLLTVLFSGRAGFSVRLDLVSGSLVIMRSNLQYTTFRFQYTTPTKQ